MKTFITTCAAIAALAVVATDNAEAGKIYWGFGTGHSTHLHSGHGSTHLHTSPLHSSHVDHLHTDLRWHDTTHVDYVPGRMVLTPFGVRYRPGRAVLHVDGHYDAVPHYGHHHH